MVSKNFARYTKKLNGIYINTRTLKFFWKNEGKFLSHPYMTSMKAISCMCMIL